MCWPTLRDRMFKFTMSVVLLGGLAIMLYRLFGDGLDQRIDAGRGVALVAAAIFIPVLLMQLFWVF